MKQKIKTWLSLAMVVIPIALIATTISVSFERAKSVQFCGSCHVMSPYVNDLRDSASENLAAKHFQHRFINQNQCYTCHTNYDFLGPVDSKWRGLKHMAAYYGGSKKPVALYKPFPNANCLSCHQETKKYKESSTHGPIFEQIANDEINCASCHGPVHPQQKTQ